jgi:hypothetical protein
MNIHYDVAIVYFRKKILHIYYGRRKGQKLAFNRKQTYNVNSIKKKHLINDTIYLINGHFFVTNIHKVLINDLVRNQHTYLQNKRLSLHNKRLSLHNERLSLQNEQCLILMILNK